ncbi:hypothetical protein FM107_03945 [Sphingobacterium sp. JB170]|nr:hypothetical protein FM107_03945 [Sphingobacterium sp. JB170]
MQFTGAHVVFSIIFIFAIKIYFQWVNSLVIYILHEKGASFASFLSI